MSKGVVLFRNSFVDEESGRECDEEKTEEDWGDLNEASEGRRSFSSTFDRNTIKTEGELRRVGEDEDEKCSLWEEFCSLRWICKGVVAHPCRLVGSSVVQGIEGRGKRKRELEPESPRCDELFSKRSVRWRKSAWARKKKTVKRFEII
jgi:hypothetical protein